MKIEKMLRNIILEFNMAKENKFFKTMSDISGAVSNVASIIGNVKSTKEERTAEKQASPSDLKERSVDVIDTIDKLEEWITVAQTDASRPAAMVLQQQLQVLKYVESPAMSGMVIDNIIVCLYKALEVAGSEMEKNAVRESVSALLQSILFMSEAKLQYDIRKNKEEAIEMISNAGNLISDSVTAVASMLAPLPGAKGKAVVPVVKNILSTQTIQSGFLTHLLSAKKKQEMIDERIKDYNTMLENLFATFDRYFEIIGPSIQIHGMLSRYTKQLIEQYEETQYKEIEKYTGQFTKQFTSMMDEISTTVNNTLGNSLYERVAKSVVGVMGAVANTNKKAETFDFNELNHIKLTLDSRRDAIVEKQKLTKDEIEEKEQQLENAGLFQRQLKNDLSSSIDNHRKQLVEIENELIAINEKVQIVDNVIIPVNRRIEEYAANLNRIAERYAVCKI